MIDIDIVAVLERVLLARGSACERDGDELRASEELVLVPRLVAAEPSQSGGMRTVSTVHVRHARAFPTAIFEFQHGVGGDLDESVASALDLWAQVDLPVLEDATRVEPLYCAALRFDRAAAEGVTALHRRVLLGPTATFAANPPPAQTAEEHGFCPCCLTTNCLDAFKALMEGDDTFGVRLYAARSEAGDAIADCRVNGEDFAAGKLALAAYAATWEPRGYEFRKQYVVMQNAAAQ